MIEQSAPVTALGVAAFLPTWAVVILIWLNGATLTAIGGLLKHMFNARTVDAQITGARQAVESRITNIIQNRTQVDLNNDKRLGILERELFGLDGDNGIRGDSKVMRRDVGAILVVLRRLAESAGVDTKEIDALSSE